ncbi:tetratricopeptide repeat-containing diguanylate cyclase [Luteimonas sp. 22616]|uniref:sensor domain-containing diguanylate cyclase n=1 Tax=Luteimonas sp. 22616 TaxID=3453951 RepID=UPI003F86AF6E
MNRMACCLVLGAILGWSLWLPASASASASFDAMLREADAVRTSDPDRFKRILDDLDRTAMGASIEQREKLEFMHAYQSIRMGDLHDAISKFKALHASATNNEVRYRSGAMLANAYAVTREFREGLIAAQETIRGSASIKDRSARHHGLVASGILYNQVGEYGLGRRYAQQVLADKPDDRNRCIAGNLLVESSLHLDKKSSDEDAVNALRQCEAIHDATLAGFSRIYLARVWHGEGRTQEAVKLLEGHFAEVKGTGYSRLIGEVHSLLAEMRLSLGDVQAAKRDAEAAVALNVGMVNSLPLVVAYKTLFEIAERTGDTAAALELYKQYAAAERGYRDDVAERELAYQMVQQEAMQQAQKIELLNKQNEVLVLHQGISEQKAQTSRLLILLLVVLAGSIGYWAFKIKRVQMSLRRMAETDALTSICNRHHFNQQSEQTLGQAARAGEDVALVMFDLDHFKSINDRFGHDTGDWVLKKVSEHCRTFCRRVDHLGRIGGEEFAILLSGCDLRGAKRVAEDCRVRIASIDTQPSGHKFLITASFGVTASSLSGYDLAKLLSHADKALYRSKREGRNRVSTFDGDVQPWMQLQVVAADGSPGPEVPPTPGVAPDHPFRSLIS